MVDIQLLFGPGFDDNLGVLVDKNQLSIYNAKTGKKKAGCLCDDLEHVGVLYEHGQVKSFQWLTPDVLMLEKSVSKLNTDGTGKPVSFDIEQSVTLLSSSFGKIFSLSYTSLHGKKASDSDEVTLVHRLSNGSYSNFGSGSAMSQDSDKIKQRVLLSYGCWDESTVYAMTGISKDASGKFTALGYYANQAYYLGLFFKNGTSAILGDAKEHTKEEDRYGILLAKFGFRMCTEESGAISGTGTEDIKHIGSCPFYRVMYVEACQSQDYSQCTVNINNNPTIQVGIAQHDFQRGLMATVIDNCVTVFDRHKTAVRVFEPTK
ncbi:MAG: hypothetical protein ABIG89_07355 [Candidatus Woesearchaeota archaeon]